MDDAARRLEREINALGRHMRARPRSMELHLDRSAYLVLLLLDYAGPSTLKEIARLIKTQTKRHGKREDRKGYHNRLKHRFTIPWGGVIGVREL